MNEKELINFIKNELNHNRIIDIHLNIGNIPYIINIMVPNIDKGINIPSIISIPQMNDIKKQIMVESNNLESDDLERVIEQALHIGMRLAILTKDKPCPLVIPLIPSEKDKPYFQQLSKECFELPITDKNYRMDIQVSKIIDNAKKLLKEKYDLKVKDKIFLNGYSSSGVFAQRFAFIYPELIDIACIGGASGSIPLPSNDFGYPIGTKDYETLFGKIFDINAYSSIKFRYYVGELETINKSNSRFDESGRPVPMHDMSYFDRSVPQAVGKKQRDKLGKNMFDRANRTIAILKEFGIDISHTIIKGRSHNNKSGLGINELGDHFINNIYQDHYSEKNIGNKL